MGIHQANKQILGIYSALFGSITAETPARIVYTVSQFILDKIWIPPQKKSTELDSRTLST